MFPGGAVRGSICTQGTLSTSPTRKGTNREPHLLPTPSPPSLAEPENSMVSVSPAMVLEQFSNAFPSSSSLTEILNAVFLAALDAGSLLSHRKSSQMSRDRRTCSKMTTHTPSTGPICVSSKLESSIDSESGCFASDRPRFLFRDNSAVDIIRMIRL